MDQKKSSPILPMTVITLAPLVTTYWIISSILTGQTISGKWEQSISNHTVYRDHDPTGFWFAIATGILLDLFFIWGAYFYIWPKFLAEKKKENKDA